MAMDHINETATQPIAAEPLATLFSNGLTPTGTQSTSVLFRRRVLVAVLNLATFAVVTAAFARLVSTGGWTALDMALLATFMLSTPWTILGVWNALVGLWLLHAREDGMRAVAPYAFNGPACEPITARIAICMTLRNEDPERALARFRRVKHGLDNTPDAARFAYFVLSDSTVPEIAAAEEACFRRWQDEEESSPLHYRRRASNEGFKAGNIRDFLARWGDDYDLMIGLDADSLMGADTILRLVRIMQANPRLGILQSLVVGLPAESAFARIFQFGMRHGMRSYTMGAAWWTGDCGPYWGHNAVLRVAPFREHCALPRLPGRPPLGGDILSHDQVEAALMRRAGYEVRVLPQECESYEDNPPHLLEFTRRDLRWCQGNMQYWRLLAMPGLKPLSRFQLAWAIAMYFGSLAWMAFIVVGLLRVFQVKLTAEPYPAGLGLTLFVSLLLMNLLPKIAGVTDVLMQPAVRARYGGAGRVLAGSLVEFVFSLLLGPIVALRISIFMIGLPFGRTVTWSGQMRDAERLSWRTALRGLWPQFLFGLLIFAALAAAMPSALWWAAPMLAGLLLAAPFAVWTASPGLGRWLARRGLCAIPEEAADRPQISALQEVTNRA